MMTVLPAIDIRAGRAVRLVRGDPAAEIALGLDPVETAAAWERAGADGLHVVDLDAALGEGDNRAVVEAILAAVRIPVQVGGGVATLERFERLLACGARRVVLGTAAVERPALVEAAVALAPDELVLAVDTRAGRVAVRGWTRLTRTTGVRFARRWRDRGVRRFLWTTIERDGTLGGVDAAGLAAVARALPGVRLVASGGVRSVEDIAALRAQAGEAVEAVVVGRALYEGAVRLDEARRAARG